MGDLEACVLATARGFSEGLEKTYLQLTIVPSPDSAEARLSVERV